MENTRAEQKNMKFLPKFIIFSCIGAFMFFVSIPYGGKKYDTAGSFNYDCPQCIRGCTEILGIGTYGFWCFLGILQENME